MAMTDHDQSSAVQDYFLDSLEYTSSFVEWNFGDADEEAQAFSSGSTAKINKVNKKTQRLHIIRLSELKEVQHQDKLRFPFLGHVSTTKSASSIPFCKLFGCVFYFVPPAAPSPTSSIVIPSWLIQTTNKAAQATITEQVVTVHCVSSLCISNFNLFFCFGLVDLFRWLGWLCCCFLTTARTNHVSLNQPAPENELMN